MARKRASMREGPLAELFRATEAASRGETPPRLRPRSPSRRCATPARDVATEQAPPEATDETLTLPSVTLEEDRRESAALEATVEHVYDFEVREAGAEEAVAKPVSAADDRAASRRRSRC